MNLKEPVLANVGPGSLISLGLFLALFSFSTGFAEDRPRPGSEAQSAASEQRDETIEKISPADAKSLLRMFLRAQQLEAATLEKKQAADFIELKAAQKARAKEWEKKEREARRQFFEENKKGAVRRPYVQDLIARRQAMFKMQAEERTERTREHQVHLSSLKTEQAAKSREFKEYLGRNERPPKSLWPQGP